MRLRQGNNSRHGFSLIELVIVVVIIGIIGAIAIPRMSRGAAGAGDSALKANLAVLRNAIDLYAAEHGGKYPLAAVMTTTGLANGGDANALLDYSDAAGNLGTKSETDGRIYGPYLRSLPPVPVGTYKGETKILSASGTGGGWVYNETDGTIKANTLGTDKDAAGTLYSAY